MIKFRCNNNKILFYLKYYIYSIFKKLVLFKIYFGYIFDFYIWGYSVNSDWYWYYIFYLSSLLGIDKSNCYYRFYYILFIKKDKKLCYFILNIVYFI